MTRLAALARAAAAQRLFISGISPLEPDDGAAPGLRTAVLLSPDEPAFWPHFRASAEAQDGRAHPLDRWSRRAIGRIACDIGAKAAFPFGGPPWRPFTRWARRSGEIHESPTGLMVHTSRGLFISFRGAILLREALPPKPAPSPCATCAAQPCRTACPVDAFAGATYNVPACHHHLDTLATSFGQKYPGGGPPLADGGHRPLSSNQWRTMDDPPATPDCRAAGCLVRRACPVGQSRRDPAQSAFHMKAFHP